MDLEQTQSLEREQDAHDSEGPEDQNRRKTSGRLAFSNTKSRLGTSKSRQYEKKGYA